MLSSIFKVLQRKRSFFFQHNVCIRSSILCSHPFLNFFYLWEGISSLISPAVKCVCQHQLQKKSGQNSPHIKFWFQMAMNDNLKKTFRKKRKKTTTLYSVLNKTMTKLTIRLKKKEKEKYIKCKWSRNIWRFAACQPMHPSLFSTVTIKAICANKP